MVSFLWVNRANIAMTLSSTHKLSSQLQERAAFCIARERESQQTRLKRKRIQVMKQNEDVPYQIYAGWERERRAFAGVCIKNPGQPKPASRTRALNGNPRTTTSIIFPAINFLSVSLYDTGPWPSRINNGNGSMILYKPFFWP